MSVKHNYSNAFHKLADRLQTTSNHLNVVNKSLEELLKSGVSNAGITKHAIIRNEELAFQLLYTHLNEYLRLLIAEMYHKKPLMIVGKVQANLNFPQIVKLGSYEAICDHMIRHVFRSFSSLRSTKSLVEQVLDETGVVVRDKTLEDATFYMNIRHLIVHNSSIVDVDFEKLYGNRIGFAKFGIRLQMSISLTRKAIRSIYALCQEIDQALIEAGYLDSYVQPSGLTA